MRTIYAETFNTPIRSETLKDIRFVRCRFIKTELPSVENCRFDDCSFVDAKISFATPRVISNAITSNSGPELRGFFLKEVSFSECDFDKVEVRRSDIQGVSFLSCSFSSFSIHECKFRGRLVISSPRGIWNVKIDGRSKFEPGFVERIDQGKLPIWRSIISWGSIRSIARLPVPKIGFSFLAMLAIVVPLYNFVLLKICGAFVSGDFTFNCNGALIDITSGRETVFTAIALFVFLIASIAHKLAEPHEIAVSGRMGWVDRREASVLRWDTENFSKFSTLSVIVFLYTISVSFLVFKYFEKVFPLI